MGGYIELSIGVEPMFLRYEGRVIATIRRKQWQV